LQIPFANALVSPASKTPLIRWFPATFGSRITPCRLSRLTSRSPGRAGRVEGQAPRVSSYPRLDIDGGRVGTGIIDRVAALGSDRHGLVASPNRLTWTWPWSSARF